MSIVQSYMLKAARRAKTVGSRAIEQLAFMNYHSAKAYCHFRFHFSTSRSKEPLIVYQMGKVGSMTIVRSLKASGLDMPIYHVHVLTQDALNNMESLFKKRFQEFSHRKHISNYVEHKELYKQITGGLRHVWRCRHLRQQIDRGIKGKKWKIVTLVRDPIARNISTLFQTIDVELDYGLDQKIKFMKIETLVEELTELFLEKFEWHEVPLTWYDFELKRVFGIDVFSSDFPKSKGYKIYKGEQAEVLLIRLENVNECAHDAFKELLNIDGFTIVKANISSQKYYDIVYRKFLSSIILPASYIDKMYTSKYAQHFYSEEEINKFKVKWHRNVTSKG